MNDLDDLHDLLTRAMTGVQPPIGLEAAARRRGRALRVRRRALAAGVGLAAAAVLAAIAVPLAGGDDRAGSTATQPSEGAVTSTPSPFVARPGWWDQPAPSMEKALRSLLPKGVEITSFQTTTDAGDLAPGQDPHLKGELTGTLTGATGPGEFEIQLTQLPDGEWDRAADEASAAESAAAVGRIAPLDHSEPGDGRLSSLAQLITAHFTCPGDIVVAHTDCRLLQDVTSGDIRGRTVEIHHKGVTTREVRIHAGSGEIYVAVANATDRKWRGPATAAAPPLTMQQLTAIADNRTWTDWVSTP